MIKNILFALIVALSLTGCWASVTEDTDMTCASDTAEPLPIETPHIPSESDTKEYTVISISTPQDLLELSRSYGRENVDYTKIKYILTNDIDMKDVEGFVPIGITGSCYPDIDKIGFQSRFDGQDYTVSNLYIAYNGDAEGRNGNAAAGLFGTVGENAVIENINIENMTIDGTGRNAFHYSEAGALAGFFSGIARNCHVSGTINGIICTGGFAGRIAGKAYIENCTADVDVSGCWYTGGFLGYSDGTTGDLTIKNCASFGSVTAYIPDVNLDSIRDVGGFAGLVSNGTVENCHSQTRMIINDSAVSVGAFIAHTHTAAILNCTYNPDYTGAWEPLFHINFRQCSGDYAPYVFKEDKSIDISKYRTTISGIETVNIQAISKDNRYIVYTSDSTVAGDGGKIEYTLRDRNDGTEKKLGWVVWSGNTDAGFFSNGDIYVMDEYSGIRIYNTDMQNFHPLFSSNVNFPTGRNIDDYYKERYLFAIRRDPDIMDYTVLYTEFVRGEKTPDRYNYFIGKLDTEGRLVFSRQLPEKVQWGDQLGFLKLNMFQAAAGEMEFYTTYKERETMRGRYNFITDKYTHL